MFLEHGLGLIVKVIVDGITCIDVDANTKHHETSSKLQFFINDKPLIFKNGNGSSKTKRKSIPLIYPSSEKTALRKGCRFILVGILLATSRSMEIYLSRY
jgi:hypothetical protein